MSRLDELIKEYCPDGVEYKKLADISNISRGKVMSKDYLNENKGDYPVYSSQTENNGKLGSITTYMFDGEYITWTTDGANAGTVFFRSGKFSITNVCGIIDVIVDYVDIKYLYYILNKEAPSYVNTGMGNPKLMSNVIAKIKIPVPPIEVQCEIVRILDNFTELTAELKMKLTAELESRKKQYEYYRDLLLNFDVRGKGTLEHYCLALKNNTKIIKLKEICEIYLGLTATPNYTKSGVKFISAQNISSDYLDLLNVKYISEMDYKKATSNAKPKRGDLLFTRVGSNLGHPVIVDTDEKICIFVSLGFLRIKNENIVDIRYLKHWMNTDLFWLQVRKNVHGAAKINLNTGWLKEFNIALPSLEIQEKIVNVLDNFEKICSDLKIGLPAEIEARQKQYEYYRDLLLTFNTKCDIILNEQRATSNEQRATSNEQRATSNEQRATRLIDSIKLLQYVYGYVKVTLEDVAKIKNGKNYKHLQKGKYPVYGSGGVMTYVNEYVYDKPSILIPRKGSLSNLFYVDKPFWNVDTIFYTEIDDDRLIPKYLYYLLQKEHLEDLNTAGGVPSLTQTILNKVSLILPPIEVQNKIVNILDNFEAICSDLKIGLPAEIEARQKQYEYYRDKLLSFDKI